MLLDLVTGLFLFLVALYTSLEVAFELWVRKGTTGGLGLQTEDLPFLQGRVFSLVFSLASSMSRVEEVTLERKGSRSHARQ